MINNMVISNEGISNVVPISENNTPLSISQLDSLIKTIIRGTLADSTPPKHERPLQLRRKRDTVVPLIDFSIPPLTRPPILEQRESREQGEQKNEEEIDLEQN
jgi:hypothetical protein